AAIRERLLEVESEAVFGCTLPPHRSDVGRVSRSLRLGERGAVAAHVRRIAVAEETEDGRLLAREQLRAAVELDLVAAAAGPIPGKADSAGSGRHLKCAETQRPGWVSPHERDARRIAAHGLGEVPSRIVTERLVHELGTVIIRIAVGVEGVTDGEPPGENHQAMRGDPGGDDPSRGLDGAALPGCSAPVYQ